MELILIAAMDLDRGIGKDNKLLYHLPADMKRFKELTTGNTVVMGRKTYESLPNGALPKRRNIVITKNEDFKAENCEICHSIDEMLKLCKDDEKVYVIGGESLYRQTIDIADRLELTQILTTSNSKGADVFFPTIEQFEWKRSWFLEYPKDDKNEYNYRFITLSRKKSHISEQNTTKWLGYQLASLLRNTYQETECHITDVHDAVEHWISKEKKELRKTNEPCTLITDKEVCKLFNYRPMKGVWPMLGEEIEPFYFSMDYGEDICKCYVKVPLNSKEEYRFYKVYEFK